MKTEKLSPRFKKMTNSAIRVDTMGPWQSQLGPRNRCYLHHRARP